MVDTGISGGFEVSWLDHLLAWKLLGVRPKSWLWIGICLKHTITLARDLLNSRV
jgi:hypothetical protein